jgi:hypothetical protein
MRQLLVRLQEEGPTLLVDSLRERWRASRLPSLARCCAALTRTSRSRERQLSERRRAMDRGLLFAVRVTPRRPNHPGELPPDER